MHVVSGERILLPFIVSPFRDGLRTNEATGQEAPITSMTADEEESPSAKARQAVQSIGRVAASVLAREYLINDFFGGWAPEDIDFLRKYQLATLPQPDDDEIIDFLGIRTAIAYHGWVTRPSSGGITVAEIPVPDDHIHAEAIEYLGLLMALERGLEKQRPDFVAVELGASYGPWVTAAGVLALRQGFGHATLIAIEASAAAVPRITEHGSRNGLTANERVTFKAVHGAAFVRDEPVYFPRVNVSVDNGAQISLDKAGKDYRGVEVEYDEVQGYSFASMTKDVETVDFLHMDLQGAEEMLLQDEDFLRVVTGKVATLFLATQSRFIEGLALKILPPHGWRLVRERPTTYVQHGRTDDVNGWTIRDGGQLWLNPRFSSMHCN